MPAERPASQPEPHRDTDSGTSPSAQPPSSSGRAAGGPGFPEIPVTVVQESELSVELRSEPGLGGVPFHHEPIADDIHELVEETFDRGILEDRLPPIASGSVRGRIEARGSAKPVLEEIAVHLEVETNGNGTTVDYHRSYRVGPWTRRSLARLHDLREEGTVASGQQVYEVLFERPRPGQVGDEPPPRLLEVPTIERQTLAGLGVRDLGAGSLVPDRPILVNARMVEDILRVTEEAGMNETGGAVLGKIVQLDEPLPGTHTRIVTVLTTAVQDPRHAGTVAEVTFSPDALAEAQEIARLRGMGESVITAFHSHGWGTGCGQCHSNPDCVIPSCTELSLKDYQVLQTLFSSKTTVLPVAGRKPGAEGERPVLEIHAWRDGQMKPVRWRAYHD